MPQLKLRNIGWEDAKLYFGTFGPFELDRGLKAFDDFWASVARQSERFEYDGADLQLAIGCYMFAIRHGES